MAANELGELIAGGHFEAAAAIAEVLLTQTPADPGLWHTRAFVALKLGQPEAALRSLERAAELAPNSAVVLTALGSVLATLGRFREAEAALHRAYRLDPADRGALLKLGSVLRDLGKLDEAVMLARRLVNQDHGDGAAWRLLGDIAMRKHDAAAAQRAFERALELDPGHPGLNFELALAALGCGSLELARSALDRALVLDPKCWAARAERLKLKRALCDWDALEVDSGPLLELAGMELPGADPQLLLRETADAALLLKAARAQARSLARQCAELPRPTLRPPPKRGAAVALRLGLLADSFGEDPVSRSLVELIERLKSQAVELSLFATHIAPDGPLRKRIQAVWPVTELQHWPAARAAQRIADAGLHVLIDLSAPDNQLAATILYLRPCARQLSWLGTACSSGKPWIDGMVVDPIAVPIKEQRNFSENLLVLPCCMLPLDARRTPPGNAERSRFGLPEKGCLLVSLVNPACYNAAVCDAWARILNDAPGARLYLSGGIAPVQVQAAMRQQFVRRGVAANRIEVLPHLLYAEHLERLTCFDLFLDPWPCGARFAVVDAIIAALPVLTLPGRHLAGRYAASLNAHLGLTDLNCGSLKQYLDSATAIATNPAAPEVLRETVRHARLHSPLFDLRKTTIALFESLCLLSDG